MVPDIPVIEEIPFIFEKESLNKIVNNLSRNPLAESIRIILANLKFVLFKDDDTPNSPKVILVTSSVKGEGKTLVSINIASLLNGKDAKVLLVGADLRNPQLHKFLNTKKELAVFQIIFINIHQIGKNFF